MNPWTALLVGLLLGWLIEYAIDWLFWRRRSTDQKIVTDLQEQLQASEERSAELEMQLAEAQAESETWQGRSSELESEMAAAETAREESYQPEEFRGSLKGKLAALGIGAAAGAAIADGSDTDENEASELSDDDLLLAATAEQLDEDAAPLDDELSDTPLDEVEDESLDEAVDVVDDEILQPGEEEVDAEEAIAYEASADGLEADEELADEEAGDGEDDLEIVPDPETEKETVAEITQDDQALETEEGETVVEYGEETSTAEVPEPDIEEDLQAPEMGTADEGGFTSTEGGQGS